MKPSRFCCVDLAAVVGLILVGSAVLSPSVARARAQARVLSCRDNLQQLGLALHNYHDAYGVFPPGRVWQPDPKKPQHENGAALSLIPYLDQAAVYNSYNFDLPWAGVANRTVRQAKLDEFLCPDDRGETITARVEPVGHPTNYAFSLGSEAWLTHPKHARPDQGPEPEGVFFDNSSIGFRNIVDGTAHTVAVAEQVIDRPRRSGSPEMTGECSGEAVEGKEYFEQSGTRWSTGHSSSGYYNARRTPNHADSDCFNVSPSGIGSLNKVARSRHEGGVNVLMADGSLRFIPNTIDLKVWRAVNTRGGREPIDLNAVGVPGGAAGTSRIRGAVTLPKPPPAARQGDAKPPELAATGLGIELAGSDTFFAVSLKWPSQGVQQNYHEFAPDTPVWTFPGLQSTWPPDSLWLVPQGHGAFLVFPQQVADVESRDRPLAGQGQSRLPEEVTFLGKLRERGTQKFLLRYPNREGRWTYLPLEFDFASAPQASGLNTAWARAEADFLRAFPAPGDQSFFAYASQRAAERAGSLSQPQRRSRGPWAEPGGRERLYEITTGALALQESLQLDRMRNPAHDRGPRDIPVDAIQGVTVRSHPWKEMIGDKEPSIEPIAALVPEDQYYVRFRTTASLKNFLEFVETWGGSVLSHIDVGGRDYKTREKIEQQICLKSSLLADLLGPTIIESLAISGSDPYLREGSDFTVIFRLRSEQVAPLFEAAVNGYIEEARKKRGDLKEDREQYAGANVQSFTTADSVIRCYRAQLGEYYVYSNSPAAIRRIIDAQRGQRPPLAKSLDFVFMRTLYPAEAKEEDGFVFLSDPFIRALTGPRLRIAEKRRIETLTSLEMVKNAALFYLFEHPGAPVPTLEKLYDDLYLDPAHVTTEPGDRITWDPATFTARSERYGRSGYLAPCVELSVDRVTAIERGEYEQFRTRYQDYWRRYFDPIGIRVTAHKDVSLAVTILPLIDNSEYNTMKAWIGGNALELEPVPRAGPVVLHFAIHLNPENQQLRQFQTMALNMMPGQNRASLEWLGERLEFWIEDSEAYFKLLRGANVGGIFRVPMVAAIEVKDPLSLTAFLVGLRTLIQTSSPNTVVFEPVDAYREYSFTRIRPAPGSWLERQEFGDPAIYYGAVGNYFYISTSLESLHHVVDSFLEAQAGNEPAATNAAGKPKRVSELFGGAATSHAALRFNLAETKKSRAAVDYYFARQAWTVEQEHMRNLWLAAHSVGLGPQTTLPSERVFGYALDSALGNSYEFDADHDEIVGSATGSLWTAAIPDTPPENSPLDRLIRSLDTLRATLEFTQDGLRTQLTVRRRAE